MAPTQQPTVPDPAPRPPPATHRVDLTSLGDLTGIEITTTDQVPPGPCEWCRDRSATAVARVIGDPPNDSTRFTAADVCARCVPAAARHAHEQQTDGSPRPIRVEIPDQHDVPGLHTASTTDRRRSSSMTTPPIDLTATNRLALAAAVTHVNAKRANDAHKAAHKAFTTAIARGSVNYASDPRDPERQIAQVAISKSTWTAKVVDLSALEQWVRATYPDKLQRRTRITGTEQDVINVLERFAPYLLDQVVEVPVEAVRELELKSREAREACGWGGEVGEQAPPGIAVSESAPRLVITYRDEDLLDELIASGIVDVTGTVLAGGEEQ
ncbi:hypothetical protein [Actinosynnema mirum]|uniref:Uncharacterized protein n=1 Tax=Actinosynnema mirum (strain ATCC 29888 / DSM 43827 / JCM 3225 / NBRC 14064 / NCIMB 13271 / NRRL B-12336 / IMRU 3971 / 101) TaxID=446462 RepID=C6WB85_ACTMD|nr:hypothetical protein [Actinosynnema mirum]ACU39376.1 hypothetical protein Amir_5558 [Actinosynnema mirum DSM 43827]